MLDSQRRQAYLYVVLKNYLIALQKFEKRPYKGVTAYRYDSAHN